MILSNICAEMLKIFLRNKKIKEAAVLARITAARERRMSMFTISAAISFPKRNMTTRRAISPPK